MRACVLPAYTGLARAYDLALGRESFAHVRALFEWLAERYGIRFRSAADVGCGTGLFARYLASCRGVPVFAVDHAPEMLSVAAENCAGARVRVLEQDIRCLALPRLVDLVTANFDVVNHLPTPADLGQAFRRVAANLVRGGHFVFDAITDCRPLGGPRVYARRLPGAGQELVQQIRWDPRTRTLMGAVVFRRGGRSRIERHVERAYSPSELGRALFDAGFAIRGVHDAATGGRARSCPPRVTVVAQRRAGGAIHPQEARSVHSI